MKAKAGKKNITVLPTAHALNILPTAHPVERKVLNIEYLLRNKHQRIAGHLVVQEVVAAITENFDRLNEKTVLDNINPDLLVFHKCL